MIEKFLFTDWNTPHKLLDFEENFNKILDDIQKIFEHCINGEDIYNNTMELYIKTQVFPRTILEYKIAVENGFTSLEDSINNPTDLFLESIDIARNLYQFKLNTIEQINRFRRTLPERLGSVNVKNKTDKYSWIRSNPKTIAKLSKNIENNTNVDLIVGAANGAIRPGLLLANILNCDLYFVRCSLHKCKDDKPIISVFDEAFFSKYREKSILVLDEDVESGSTINKLVNTLQDRFKQTYSAAIVKYYLAPAKLSFVGDQFYD